MTIYHHHIEPKALEVSEQYSAARELYIEQQRLVKLTFEMSKEEAWDAFNALPKHVLPPLPHGYQWVRANDNYSVIRNEKAEKHAISIILYGPDAKQYINFICQVDDVTTYSFAHTKSGSGPKDRTYPMTNNDYKVLDYDYASKRYNSHVRGHLIDHQDTILGRGTLSTYDPRNYIPEPPEYEWGLGIRRLKVAELRKQRGGGAYAQLNTYPETPLVTMNGTLVPEDVRLYAYSHTNGYQAKDVFHVDFEESMKRPDGKKVLEHAALNFTSSVHASPVASLYNPDFSERALRGHAREAAVKEYNIGTSIAPSRFAYKDKLYSACDAGDREFETPGRQLHAGIFSEKEESTSNHYLKRSLFFGEKLGELDEGIGFKAEEIREGKVFFRKKGEDLSELADHFKQLCS